MDSSNTGFSSVELADTALWRLLVDVSQRGLNACLQPVEDEDDRRVQLVSQTWEGDAQPLLTRIENAVYDNPRMLDDYATRVSVGTRRYLLYPKETLTEGDIEDAFTEVYPCQPEDIMTDDLGDIVCAYTLTPGLPAFLRRTLPGSRVNCHITEAIRRRREEPGDMTRVYVEIRPGECDILAFDGTEILSVSTQGWDTPDDIAYRVALLIQAYGLQPDAVEVRLGGDREPRAAAAATLRKFLKFVTLDNADNQR